MSLKNVEIYLFKKEDIYIYILTTWYDSCSRSNTCGAKLSPGVINMRTGGRTEASLFGKCLWNTVLKPLLPGYLLFVWLFYDFI